MAEHRGNKYKHLPLSERFHHSYVKSENGCWEWVGTIHSVNGYGIIHANNKDTLAHRVSWLLHMGELPTTCVLHKCDNRKCVNPEHLFLGSRRENNIDRHLKNRTARGKQHGKYIHGKYVDQPRKSRSV